MSMKYEIVARRLQTELDKQNMSYAELANLSGVSKASISNYIHGKHCPNNEKAYKIAMVLGCEPSYIMGFDGETIEANLTIKIDSIYNGLNQQNRDKLKSYADFLLSEQNKNAR